MNPLRALRNTISTIGQSRQLLAEIRSGLANQTEVYQAKSNELILGIANQSSEFNAFAKDIRAVLAHLGYPMANEAEKAAEDRAARSSLQLMSIRSPLTNDVEKYANVFDGIEPWSGTVPKGFCVNWLGALTAAEFAAADTEFSAKTMTQPEQAGTAVSTRHHTIADGEYWLEAIDCVEAVRDARGRFTMITLGARWGTQAIDSYLALQKINPLPAKLVAVEPEPTNFQWMIRHFRDNGIDPDQHWLVGSAISDTNQPVFFPVGAPGSGAQNCFSTNELSARENYAKALATSKNAQEAVRNLLINQSTGLRTELSPGLSAEIKLMSAVRLGDLLAPFELVDYLESDIQQSEIVVFPKAMSLLKKKVRRTHIGTHGADVHTELARLFRRDGWEIVFDFPPNSTFPTKLGPITLNDGVLTARNPNL